MIDADCARRNLIITKNHVCVYTLEIEWKQMQ